MATNHASKVIQQVRRVVLRDGADLSDGQLLSCFIEQRDEDAFAAVVKRHGAMVWGVCHRVLQGHQDAEDAFQATFLVLVRKAASVVPRERLGNWLYGVAFQTAVRARAMNARQRTRERTVTDLPEPQSAARELWSDLLPLLDQELARLPDKYRVPVVLCDLEGKTYQEAARHLGCPSGTFASRLARARAMLAKRLARHGLAVSGGTLAVSLSQGAVSGGVPTSVMSATLKHVSLVGTGQAATTVVSANVVALMEGVLKTMVLKKLTTAMAVLVALALGFVGVGVLVPGLDSGSRDTNSAGIAPQQGNTTRKELTNKDEQIRAQREQLQGVWLAVSAEKQGEEITEAKVKDARINLTISGDRFALATARKQGALEGTFKIDPAQQPRTMDWSAVRPEDGKTLTTKGIYELQGDTLKFCYGEERPTEFKTKPDRELDQRMYVFKKQRP